MDSQQAPQAPEWVDALAFAFEDKGIVVYLPDGQKVRYRVPEKADFQALAALGLV